jgi:hypothetical protein
MTTRDMSHDVLTTCVSHRMMMGGRMLRRLYDWVMTTFGDFDRPPNTFDAEGGGFSGERYLDFARGRSRLERANFGHLSRLTCAMFRHKQNNMTIGWEFQCANLELEMINGREIFSEKSGRWHAQLSVSPDLLGIESERCVAIATDFARLTMEEGGFIFFMHRNRGPCYYVPGIDYEAIRYPSDRTYDESANISSWSYARHVHLTRPWLRDVYPINFLGPAVAALRVEGKQLGDWLRADPVKRGTVEVFPCAHQPRMLLWKPPLQQIPVLREQLYKAGLVWHREYYLDYSDGNAPPFVPKDPPPEIMRASYYRGRDPRLTR